MDVVKAAVTDALKAHDSLADRPQPAKCVAREGGQFTGDERNRGLNDQNGHLEGMDGLEDSHFPWIQKADFMDLHGTTLASHPPIHQDLGGSFVLREDEGFMEEMLSTLTRATIVASKEPVGG